MQINTFIKHDTMMLLGDNGYCPYCDTYTSSKIILETTGKTTIEDFEKFTCLGMTCSGPKWYYYNMLDGGCCRERMIRTRALEFEPNKKFKKVVRKWQRFLDGERGVVVKEKNEGEEGKFDDEEIANLSVFFSLHVNMIKEELAFVVNLDQGLLEFEEKWFQILKSKGENQDYFLNFLLPFYGKNKGKIEIGKEEFISKMKEKILKIFSDDRLKNWEVEFDKKGFIKFLLKKVELSKKKENAIKEENKEKKSELEVEKLPTEENSIIFDEKNFDIYEAKKRTLRLEFVPAYFTKHKQDLYNRYNKIIHKEEEETDEENFKNFICSRNIVEETFPSKIDPEEKLSVGCFHLEIYLDEKLIGVVNQRILKTGLQSGYFFYEPIFKPLNLGIVTSLMEIEKVKNLNKFHPEFKYYYMSTYIHHNPKLKYKVDYKPVEIWCPVTKKFFDFEDEIIQKNLDEKNVRLAPKEVEINDKREEFSEDILGFLGEIWSIRDIYFEQGTGIDRFLTGEEKEVNFNEEKLVYKSYKPKDDFVYVWLSQYYLKCFWLYEVLGKDIVRDLVWVQNL